MFIGGLSRKSDIRIGPTPTFALYAPASPEPRALMWRFQGADVGCPCGFSIRLTTGEGTSLPPRM
jgi:hypothetical protein